MSARKSTASPQEIDKFTRLKDVWWDPQGPQAMLHRMNPLRLAFIQNHAPLPYQKMLDVGCGAGLLSLGLAKLGHNVTALDASAPLIEVAQMRAQEEGLQVTFKAGLLENEPLDAHYDAICLMEILEHAQDPGFLLEEACKRLKPEGKLFISTLNRSWSTWLFGIVAAEYLFQWLPRGTHSIEHCIKPSEIECLLNAQGLRLVKIQGLKMCFPSMRLSSSDDVRMHYTAVFSRP